MLIIPAIDLRDGKVVRLCQGRLEDETIYPWRPEDVAALWQEKGAKRLHIVDLDGAIWGRPKNLEAIKRILKAIDIPIQFGGGIRTLKDIEEILNLGVEWVILGTSVILDHELLTEALIRFSGRILVGIDARKDRVSIRGWQEETQILAKDLVANLEKIGVKRIIYTDILRDGLMQGPNFEAIMELTKVTNLKIIVSGGISSLEDIKRLKTLEKEGLVGIIIGKALYEGKIDLEEAIRIGDQSSQH